MTKIKICGLKSAKDIELAKEADVFGFIVDIPSSPRNLSIAQAKALIRIAKKYGEVAVVSTATSMQKLAEIANKLKPDILQIHRETREEELIKLRKIAKEVKIMPVISIPAELKNINTDSLKLIKKLARHSDALLLDTVKSSVYGKTHNWIVSKAIRNALYPFPIILAGGLTPKNVQKAIQLVRPYAVDVVSGVEKELGVKDEKKLKEFIRKVREVG